MEPLRAEHEERRLSAGGPGGKAAPEPGWLRAVRERAWARFRELGVPSPREEAYRHTDLTRLSDLPYRPAPRPALSPSQEAALLQALGAFEADRLVFVDGHFAPEHAQVSGLPAAAQLVPLGALVRDAPGRARELLLGTAPEARGPWDALNAACFEDGAALCLERGARLARPVHLVFASTGGAGQMAHPRVVVSAGEASQALLVESHVGLGDGDFFSNAVTEVRLEARAALTHLRLQIEGVGTWHLGRVSAELGPASRFTSRAFAFGAALSRTDVEVRFGAEQASCVLDGLYAARGDQVLDFHTAVDHAAPSCRSEQLYKGVLDGRARGVFLGEVRVRPGAQKTDASQHNPVLLLSDDAVAQTRPQLEIRADDVQCKHGAAVGRLDPEALFYLRARGLGPGQARSLLVHAFAREVIDRVELEPVRAALEAELTRRLAAPAVGEAR